MPEKLGELIDRYHERFKDDANDGFSLFDTTLSHDALVVRLERALSRGNLTIPRPKSGTKKPGKRSNRVR